MVLGQVGRMTIVGGAVGLVAAFGVGRLAQSLLYEIDGLTPTVAVAEALAMARRGARRRVRPGAPGVARRPDGRAPAPVDGCTPRSSPSGHLTRLDAGDR